jgi:hypothetical protein
VWLRCSSSRASTGQLDWAEGVMLRPVALDVGLSKPGVWWRRRDLNLRPRAYEFLAVGLAVVLGRSLVVDFRVRKPKAKWMDSGDRRSLGPHLAEQHRPQDRLTLPGHPLRWDPRTKAVSISLPFGFGVT